MAATGTKGVGQYRTQTPFVARREFPDVEAQVDLYRQIIDGADERPATFRALDVGGDKHLQSFSTEVEETSLMGWRSMRILMKRISILRHPVRALIRASSGKEMRLMFPMVSDITEFEEVKRIVDREMALARHRGFEPLSALFSGAMIEVPAMLWQLDKLPQKVDFLPIGTNGLFQFIFAADRANGRVTSRYDKLPPAFLRVLDQITRACGKGGAPVAVCSEMAGHPLEALALIGLG
ncbi:MAG: hypothetical protein OSB69_15385 [Alphaproteobacteria bacterium]|nr:hypothetical protein [Alphaproteobacteria bacterium]